MSIRILTLYNIAYCDSWRPHHSVTVVGDDDQSIYRWRGADLGNILRFEQDFPGARTIRLEENYRSTSTILAAANSVISNNVARKGKNLFTSREESESIGLRVWSSERRGRNDCPIDQVAYRGAGTDPGEIAILYRTNAQSRPLEDALRKIGYIPRIYGGTSYDRREVKDAIAYLRLLVNPQSDIDFERIVNVPARAVGKTSIGKIRSASVQDGVPMFVIAEAMGFWSLWSNQTAASVSYAVHCALSKRSGGPRLRRAYC